jgi:hypothetical protein
MPLQSASSPTSRGGLACTMKKLTLLLLLAVFGSPVVRGQSHTPGNGGEAHQLAVSKDLKTVYVADSLNARVLKLERNVGSP